MRRVHYDNIDSTNSQAHRLVREAEPTPMLITATTQSAGRGRNGREWQSPRGGIWMSAVWPVTLAPEKYLPFPIIVGLAVWEAIHETICRFGAIDDRRLKIKWPNDILLDDHKVSGILCETITQDGQVTHLIAGVGINVAFTTKMLKGQLRHAPTTLHDRFGADADWIEPTIAAFDRHLDQCLRTFEREGFAGSLLRDARRRLAYVGATKVWQSGEQHNQGVIEGIDAAGRLLLDIEGTQIAIDSGELTSAKPTARI
jgi:BirA family biotin operon repressor/biotin-[acetyl-CoA-carboxylase] ligase